MNSHNIEQNLCAPGNFIIDILRIILIGYSISAFSLPAVANDENDYLNQLSEEISKPEYLDKARAEILSSEKEERANKSGVIANNSDNILRDIKQFEFVLQRKFPSSYKLYSELKPPGRVKVYDTYKSSQKLSSAKRKIIDIFLGVEN